MPSWGKSDSYALLVSYYLEKENLTEAKKVLALYPEDYMLNEKVKTMNEKKWIQKMLNAVNSALRVGNNCSTLFFCIILCKYLNTYSIDSMWY